MNYFLVHQLSQAICVAFLYLLQESRSSEKIWPHLSKEIIKLTNLLASGLTKISEQRKFYGTQIHLNEKVLIRELLPMSKDMSFNQSFHQTFWLLIWKHYRYKERINTTVLESCLPNCWKVGITQSLRPLIGCHCLPNRFTVNAFVVYQDWGIRV